MFHINSLSTVCKQLLLLVFFPLHVYCLMSNVQPAACRWLLFLMFHLPQSTSAKQDCCYFYCFTCLSQIQKTAVTSNALPPFVFRWLLLLMFHLPLSSSAKQHRLLCMLLSRGFSEFPSRYIQFDIHFDPNTLFFRTHLIEIFI